MKQTRTIKISDRVFTLEDLQRIAAILEKQSSLARKSDHQATSEYSIMFADGTTHQSDSADLFSDHSSLAPARPVAIRMSFHNFKLGRHISLSLDHGDSSFGNGAVVSAEEPEWLSQNFLAIKETIEKVRPQVVWLKQHHTLLLNLIALGIGSFGIWMVDMLGQILTQAIDLSEVIKPFPKDSPWHRILLEAGPFLYAMKWVWYWACGCFWGAFAVRTWLLSLWPSIEFDFGLPHLKTERMKRKRLAVVGTLVVVPILRSLIYDLMKSRF